MKSRFHKVKMNILSRISNPYSMMFHIAGIACIIWFLVRVLPKPDRIQYPCQQLSITVVSSYIIFWSILWGALFNGLAIWVRRVKTRSIAFLPIFLVSFVLIFTISSGVFANIYNNESYETSNWEPIPNEPIGTPQGVNPGRVVWVWDPDATESDLKGFWWQKQNNNQEVIDEMFSKGIHSLTGVEDDALAWNILFKYFNQIHGSSEVGYQPGEKIAIKINLNNCYGKSSYITMDNDRDASPYVVKALLRQLVNKVGVAQEDITVFDASRIIPNWFYNRVYYKSYPAIPLVPEFPDIHYVDSSGSAFGREKVQGSSEKIYFADGTDLTNTLPSFLIEAKYLINMPMLKKHPVENGVTLSGKNLFGSFIEPVASGLHQYHVASLTTGNTDPQVDLLADEDIGGKTLLYLGDGTFATKVNHLTIAKFNMYPFNGDWTNSLFFSQDPVAIDSVMFDFLFAEGTNPCEQSQNYLHQSAEPPLNVYDPENDGIFLKDSLGVHEHWNKNIEIFSSERYFGPLGNGIDFVAIGREYEYPDIIIINPNENYLYISGLQRLHLPMTVIIGGIDVEAIVNGVSGDVEKVEFYIDNELKSTDFDEPYLWTWERGPNFIHTLKAVAYYNEGNILEDKIVVWKFF